MAITASIDVNRVRVELEQRHRDAMLDLVLAWGSLDGAFGALLSSLLGVPLAEGAEQIGKFSSSGKLAAIIKIVRNAAGGVNAARILKRHKKTYERYSFARNRIAHSHFTTRRQSATFAGEPDPYTASH